MLSVSLDKLSCYFSDDVSKVGVFLTFVLTFPHTIWIICNRWERAESTVGNENHYVIAQFYWHFIQQWRIWNIKTVTLVCANIVAYLFTEVVVLTTTSKFNVANIKPNALRTLGTVVLCTRLDSNFNDEDELAMFFRLNPLTHVCLIVF
jgi:hypothetical protein